MICAFARSAREDKRRREEEEEEAKGERKDLYRLYFGEFLANVLAPSSPSRYFRYVSNRGLTYFHFSQPLGRRTREILFALPCPLPLPPRSSKSFRVSIGGG